LRSFSLRSFPQPPTISSCSATLPSVSETINTHTKSQEKLRVLYM
jgi:hypothetical protein